jgi:hypothetical protein
MTNFSFESESNIEIPLKGNDSNNATAAINWCMKHLPKSTWAVRSKWPMNEYLFYFSRPQDASWFSLSLIT